MDYSVFTYLILISKGVPSRKHGPKNYCRGRAASKVVAQFTSTDTAAWAHDILSPHAASVGDCFYNRCLPHQLLLTPLFFHRGGEPDESRAARCSAPRIRPAYGPPRAGRRRRGWGSSSPWRGKQSRGGLGAWVPASQYAVGRWEGGGRGAGQGRAGRAMKALRRSSTSSSSAAPSPRAPSSPRSYSWIHRRSLPVTSSAPTAATSLATSAADASDSAPAHVAAASSSPSLAPSSPNVDR